MPTQIIIGPGPGSGALIEYQDRNSFKYYRLIDDTIPPVDPASTAPHSVHAMAGVGSESFCLEDDSHYRKWADGSWANTAPAP